MQGRPAALMECAKYLTLIVFLPLPDLFYLQCAVT